MAIYPCSVGQHRYAGPQISFYTSLLNDSPDADRRRLRLCGGHWGEVEPHLRKFEVTEDGMPACDDDAPFICATCGEPLLERGWQVFVTCYPTKNDRKDYWFGIHTEHPTPAWFPTRF